MFRYFRGFCVAGDRRPNPLRLGVQKAKGHVAEDHNVYYAGSNFP